MTVSTPKVSTSGIHASSLETHMLPDNFDPFFAAWGIKRRDFTQPQPQKVTQ